MASPSTSPSPRLSPAPRRPLPRCVYVNCFGSHPCGSVLVYEGRGSRRLQRHEAGRAPWGTEADERMEAEADETAAGSAGSPDLAPPKTERPPAPRAREPPQLPGQAGGSRWGRAARAVRTRPGNVSDAFEFYMPLNEAAKITKKKKKCAAWDSVYKVISKMLNENEKIRDRMNFKQGCAENGDLVQSTEEESSYLSGFPNTELAPTMHESISSSMSTSLEGMLPRKNNSS